MLGPRYSSKESPIILSGGLRVDTFIDELVKKTPVRNSILTKYSNFQKLNRNSKVSPAPFSHACTETDDLTKIEKSPGFVLSSNELLETVKTMSGDSDFFKTLLEENSRGNPAILIDLCLLLREEYITQQQKIVDMHNQVKFFKSLAKNKK